MCICAQLLRVLLCHHREAGLSCHHLDPAADLRCIVGHDGEEGREEIRDRRGGKIGDEEQERREEGKEGGKRVERSGNKINEGIVKRDTKHDLRKRERNGEK